VHTWTPAAIAVTVMLLAVAAGLLTRASGASGRGALVFGPERRLGQAARNPSSPSLRIAPDGRLAAAWTEKDPDPAPRPAPSASHHGAAHHGDWMITFDMRVVLLASSGDGGATWSAPRKVNSAMEATQGEENEPKIAFAPDRRALVVWSAPNDKGDKSRANVRFALEDGRGAFTPTQTLNEVKDTARFPDAQRSPAGPFLVTWVDRQQDSPTPRAIFMTRLDLQGRVMGRSYRVGENACDCCRLGVAFADRGRTVYLAHREVTKDNIRNHVLRTSTDGGVTFGPPVTISDDGWQTGCPHSGPTIAVDRRGYIHATWFTQGRTESEAGVYYAVSRDGGRSFAPRVLVHGNTAPEVLHTTLAVTDAGTVHLAWDNLDESRRSQIFVRALAPDGLTWSPVQRISQASENARRPAIALSADALHVAWTESEGEKSSIALRSAPLR
jgi:hypothetical protein